MSSPPFLVLLVDCTARAADAAEALRRGANVEVVIATELAEALLISRDLHPSAVLIGDMPGDEELEQQLRDANPGVPLLTLADVDRYTR